MVNKLYTMSRKYLHSHSTPKDADTLMYCIGMIQFAEIIESKATSFSNRVTQYSFGLIN